MVWDTQNYARMARFSKANKRTSVWWGGVWSKSSISHKNVPRNNISKSFEGKQFITVRWGLETVTGKIASSKLMQLGIHLAFICHFLAKRFHTLKIESDFFSRQGHWPLYRTGVYNCILLKKNPTTSSNFYFWF